MTACTPTYGSPLAYRPSPTPVRRPAPATRPTVPGGGVRTPEADRAFEAAVRWFLAVSRAA
jgi:hypothetical protein